jgi:hypothetical protein
MLLNDLNDIYNPKYTITQKLNTINRIYKTPEFKKIFEYYE